MMHNSSSERGVTICETNSIAGTKAHEEEGEEGSPGTEEEIPPQTKVKATVKQVVSCSRGDATLEQGNNARRKKQQRCSITD